MTTICRADLRLFLYLQILDVLTTLVGFKMGAVEASPFIRFLMGIGAANGVIASKAAALGLVYLCLRLRKDHVIGWINYWCGALVIWNLMIMLATR